MDSTSQVLEALSRSGLLLTQDKKLPNVVTIVTGESLKSSWWSHPKAHLIFAALSEVSEHPDVLFTKLLDHKDTLVHRFLWPAFLAVAMSGEPWQRRGLSAPGRRLLEQATSSKAPVRSSGSAVKELAARLLVHTQEVHTEAGRHEMAVEPWSAWSARVGVEPLKSLDQARETLEWACELIGAPASALPWPV